MVAMTMSTQTLAEAARWLATATLKDRIKVYAVGDPVTTGIEVTKPLELLANGIPALVQSTTLQNAAESASTSVYSIKVERKTVLDAGMVVEVSACAAEPDLVGYKLLVDKVTLNGLAMIRKATASDYEVVNQEGKEGLR